MNKMKHKTKMMRLAMTLALILLTATTAWAQEAITGLTYNSAGGYYEINNAYDLSTSPTTSTQATMPAANGSSRPPTST